MEITANCVIIFLVTITVLAIGRLSKFPSPALRVRPVICTEQVQTTNMGIMGKFLKKKKKEEERYILSLRCTMKKTLYITQGRKETVSAINISLIQQH